MVSRLVGGLFGAFIHFFIYYSILKIGVTFLGAFLILFLKEKWLLFVVNLLTLGGLFISIVGTLNVYKEYYKRDGTPIKHDLGNSRYATTKEVLKSGLLGDGIVFGKKDRHLVTKPPEIQGHTLIVGGTGSGKSRGVAIPTLLKWTGSVMAIDIKGELSKLTKERRIKNGDIFIFDPLNPKTDCYDPIAFCDTVAKCQDLARTLIPIPKGADPIWSQSAQSILAAFVFEGNKYNYKLCDIARTLMTTGATEMIYHCSNHPLSEVRTFAGALSDMPEKTLGSVLSELRSKLFTLATDEGIRNSIRKSDFTGANLLKKGTTIYLKIDEDMLDQYKEILAIIINQTMKTLMRKEEYSEPPVLILLDELPRLGMVQDFSKALATLRSRNIHILSIIQSMAQLDDIYGKDQRKIIADNCRFKLVLGATDPETQKYFSDLIGYRSGKIQNQSTGNSVFGNVGHSETSIPLIRPEEFGMLKNPILISPDIYPVVLEKAYWDIEKI